MRITASADVAAPIAAVFAAATDHEGFVRQARRRGAEVRRLGDAWHASFPLRGRVRRVEAGLARLDPPALVEAAVQGEGFAGGLTADLLALSHGATRLRLTVEVRARTLPARLLLQGMRLARRGLERRMQERLDAWAREVESREVESRAGRAGPAPMRPGGNA